MVNSGRWRLGPATLLRASQSDTEPMKFRPVRNFIGEGERRPGVGRSGRDADELQTSPNFVGRV
jgi:hypothetical protein